MVCSHPPNPEGRSRHIVRCAHPVKQPEELAPGECLIKMHVPACATRTCTPARGTGPCPTSSHSLVGTKVLVRLLPLARTPSTPRSRLATESASSGSRTPVSNASSAARVWNKVRYLSQFL